MQTLLCKIKQALSSPRNQKDYDNVSDNITEDLNECPVGEEKPWSIAHIPREETEIYSMEYEPYPTWEIALKISIYIIPIVVGVVSQFLFKRTVDLWSYIHA